MLHLHTALNYFQLNHTTPPNAENPQYKELKFKQNFINTAILKSTKLVLQLVNNPMLVQLYRPLDFWDKNTIALANPTYRASLLPKSQKQRILHKTHFVHLQNKNRYPRKELWQDIMDFSIHMT